VSRDLYIPALLSLTLHIVAILGIAWMGIHGPVIKDSRSHEFVKVVLVKFEGKTDISDKEKKSTPPATIKKVNSEKGEGSMERHFSSPSSTDEISMERSGMTLHEKRSDPVQFGTIEPEILGELYLPLDASSQKKEKENLTAIAIPRGMEGGGARVGVSGSHVSEDLVTGNDQKGMGNPVRSIAAVPTPLPIFKAEPKYHLNPKPLYPPSARERGFEGVTLLRVEVLADGRVGRIAVERSSGYSILDESALSTVKDWIFEPAREGDRPVTMWVQVPIRFQLQ